MKDTDTKKATGEQSDVVIDAATEPETSESGVQNTLPMIPQLLVALGLLVIIFAASYIPTISKDQAMAEPTQLEARVESALEVEEKEDVFLNAEVTARAAYVWDVKNQKALYNKNASAQLPLASLTKLMTAIVAAETLEETDSVTITDAAVRQESASGLAAGARFAFEALNDFTLVSSSNDGAYALAAAAGESLRRYETQSSTAAFVDAMNRKAEEIGLSQSYFTNPTGLDQNELESGSYGSARDMAFLMEYIVTEKPDIFERTNEAQYIIYDETGGRYTAENTSPIIEDIPGLIASKTGYTDLAGGNLVVAFDAGFNHPVVVTVLGSTHSGRFYDVLTLTELAREAVTE